MTSTAPQGTTSRPYQDGYAREISEMDGQNTVMRATRLLACAALATGMFATRAAAETTTCPLDEGRLAICGVVFDDADSNKVQGGTEPNIGGPDVIVVAVNTSTHVVYTAETSCDVMYPETCGFYGIGNIPAGTYDVCVIKASDVQSCDGHSETQSVPVPPGAGVTVPGVPQDIGRPGAPVVSSGPGTGTPGYWKNHPEAWPVTTIQIGNKTYTREQAIGFMGKVGGDKSITIFSSLLSAKLNVLAGNPDSCVASSITAADAWFVTYVATMPGKISGSSAAWAGVGQGDATHQVLDNYNNGLLPCAHHRD